jgi:hypothetical protein
VNGGVGAVRRRRAADGILFFTGVSLVLIGGSSTWIWIQLIGRFGLHLFAAMLLASSVFGFLAGLAALASAIHRVLEARASC